MPPSAIPSPRSLLEPHSEQSSPRGNGPAARCKLVELLERPDGIEVVVEAFPDNLQCTAVVDPTLHPPPSIKSLGGDRQVVGVPLPVAAVVVAEQRQADRHRLPVLQQITHKHQVPKRFGHLLPAELDQSHVQPVPDERLACHRLGLRSLTLVMGEHEVPASSVEIDRLAQLPHRQRRALELPSGRPGPQRESQDGSSGSDRCHSTKSSGSRLFGSSGLPPCSAANASIESRSSLLSFPNPANVETSK